VQPQTAAIRLQAQEKLSRPFVDELARLNLIRVDLQVVEEITVAVTQKREPLDLPDGHNHFLYLVNGEAYGLVHAVLKRHDTLEDVVITYIIQKQKSSLCHIRNNLGVNNVWPHARDRERLQ